MFFRFFKQGGRLPPHSHPTGITGWEPRKTPTPTGSECSENKYEEGCWSVIPNYHCSSVLQWSASLLSERSQNYVPPGWECRVGNTPTIPFFVGWESHPRSQNPTPRGWERTSIAYQFRPTCKSVPTRKTLVGRN